MANVPRGSIRKLRVVALGYRAAGVGSNGSGGPGGGALISTPVAVGNGTWDQKIVLGEAEVQADGSLFFILPARTPVYFQAIDAQGRAAQTMRSWMTLQPGENQSCVGCHESKNSSPVAVDPGFSMALRAGPQPLAPFQGPARGFSFSKEIQPILDQHCVSCHNDPNQNPKVEHVHSLVVNHGNPQPEKMRPHQEIAAAVAERVRNENFGGAVKPAFSLRANEVIDEGAKRRWSEAYLNLTGAITKDGGNGAYRGTFDGRIVNWIGSQSIPGPLPPYAAGSCRSELIPLLEAGHGGARLSREEIERLCCWIDLYVPFCGTYTEAAAWTEAEAAKYKRYQDKRDRLAEEENQRIEEWIGGKGN